MLFTGHAEATFDAKQRLSIPAKYRKGLGSTTTIHELGVPEEMNPSAWYCFPWPGRIIRLYPAAIFEKLAGEGSPTLFPNEDEAEFEAAFFGSVERVEVDSAGRVMIPKRHLEETGLKAAVVIVGARNRLEIRDRIAWLATGPERLAKLPSQLSRVETHRSHVAQHVNLGPLRGAPHQ